MLNNGFINKALTIVKVLASWIIYFLSWTIPKDRELWVFNGWHKGSIGETFADNPKYLYLHISNNKEVYNLRPIWIGEDTHICERLKERGYEAFPRNSLRGLFYSLRAKYTFISAQMRLHNWCLSGGSRVVQLWHGDGFKNMHIPHRQDLTGMKYLKLFLQPALFKKHHFFVSSSSYTSRVFIEPSFGINSSEVKTTGLPRYDVLFEKMSGYDIDIHESLKDQLHEVKGQGAEKILLYAPTFRRNKSQTSPLKLKLLDQFLRAKRYYLFVSSHPKFSTTQYNSEVLTNIITIPSDFDKYPLLDQFDAVITDYSSICIEFLLLRKPTIFYTYDLEEYLKNPGVRKEIWEDFPGPRIETLEELISSISSVESLWSQEHEKMRDTIFPSNDASSSKRLVEEIVGINF